MAVKNGSEKSSPLLQGGGQEGVLNNLPFPSLVRRGKRRGYHRSISMADDIRPDSCKMKQRGRRYLSRRPSRLAAVAAMAAMAALAAPAAAAPWRTVALEPAAARHAAAIISRRRRHAENGR